MSNQYQSFVFESYAFDKASKTLKLNYSFDGQLKFCEQYKFDFDFVDYNPQQLDRACQLLFLLAGVSYYKAYLPPKISLGNLTISPSLAAFLSQTYQNGLGEFFYVNQLDPNQAIDFPAQAEEPQAIIGNNPPNGVLVGIGGGKDSLLTVEILRQQADLKIATWSLNHRSQLEPLVQRIGLTHLWVDRQIDASLLELNRSGAYNGHVPISAILAAAGSLVAILSGYQDVVVSNESSASEPNLTYRGKAINHQYSKSLQFETSFQAVLAKLFGDSVRYYSFLRPISEVHIAHLFAQRYFDKYHDVFSSCNRAFTHSSNHIFWDGTCPKCAFIFLAFTPFLKRQQLEDLFSGKNLLLTANLEPTYRQLLGIEGNKPLECVGEVKESRAAMTLAKQIYPELSRYQYELPPEYDYQSLSQHSMPNGMYQNLLAALTS
jgi:hypothetical protein